MLKHEYMLFCISRLRIMKNTYCLTLYVTYNANIIAQTYIPGIPGFPGNFEVRETGSREIRDRESAQPYFRQIIEAKCIEIPVGAANL